METNKNNPVRKDDKKQQQTSNPIPYEKKHKRSVIATDSTPVTKKVRPSVDHDGLSNEGTNVNYEESR